MVPKIVRYGAGTNSTALLVGMWERGERPDAIVFADTGGERPATYAYLTMFSTWLVERGFPILRVGLPLPGKSACFFCPNTSKERVRDLRRALPDLFARAVAIEKNAAAEDTRTGTRSAVVGLGRRVRWADIGEEDERQVKLWPDEMPCDCYDGGAA